MVIEFHPKYMTHLAQRYLSIYGKFGYDEAKKWYHEFLTPELRQRIGNYIRAEAGDQGLDTD